MATEQVSCGASTSGGWACTPKNNNTALPARPLDDAVSTQSKKESSEEKSIKQTKEETTKTEGKALAARSKDFSHLDWIPREKLTKEQLAEASPYCSGAYIEPQRPGINDKTPTNKAPIYVSAKVSRYQQDKDEATLAGDVVLRQGSIQAKADKASLYRNENRGELVGNVRLRDKGALLVGDKAKIQLDSGAARVDNAEYVIYDGHSRGSALYAKRGSDAIVRLKSGSYTTCGPNSNAWHIQGNNITLDPNTGFGTATNATLRVKNIPILYTPYIYFPIDDRRQSGFLPPTVSSSSDNGFTIQTPYYFNLAPNYDATIYPTYMHERGLLLENEFRYLTENSEGQLGAAYLNDHNNDRRLQSDYRDERWLYSWQHKQGLSSRLLGEVDFTSISDPYYFQDLDTNLGIDTPDYVNQQGKLTYRGDNFTARLNAQSYELANITDITPYDRLPQLTLTGKLPIQPGGLNFTYKADATHFDRDLRDGNYINEDGDVEQSWYDTRVQGLERANGTRAYAEPSISLPLRTSYGYIKPQMKYSYTQYNLSLDNQGENTLLDEQSFHSNEHRSVGIFSIDSGLYFDRTTQLFGNNVRQTLEPRLFYLYVPEKDQTDIPIFDTKEIAFSYNSLFRDNRFSGYDRIGDENKLSLGVTSRWIEDNGFERQRFSLGQAFYFADRKVQMPGIDYQDREDSQSSVSPYALQYQYRFNHDWKLTSDFNWDPDSHSTQSGSAMFHYQPENDPNKIFNIGYRYRNDSVHYDEATGTYQINSDFGTPGDPNYIKDYYKVSQHDVSLVWPIVSQWNFISRWQYDYSRNRTLEAFGGFEYNNCCWKFRAIDRYWIDYDEVSLDPDENDDPDRGIFFQVVFKGLGSLTGSSTESFLEKGIQGYKKREDQSL
ncbi:UNVERIFIED_CONTAM: hypothetical protein GTU68_036757 [Idotea baltica]|nr:hypothetical protein [Idotea baltica]